MMDHDLEKKLQAFLDGELDQSETHSIAERIRSDSEAETLCNELRETKRLLETGELKIEVPVSRVFYWSKIERAIAPENFKAGSRGHWGFGRVWLRFGLPLAAAAAVLLLFAFWPQPSREPETMAGYFHEIENPLDEENSITFHSEAAAMTIVWVDASDGGPHISW